MLHRKNICRLEIENSKHPKKVKLTTRSSDFIAYSKRVKKLRWKRRRKKRDKIWSGDKDSKIDFRGEEFITIDQKREQTTSAVYSLLTRFT